MSSPTLNALVHTMRHEADGIISVELRPQRGGDFPAFTPGSHIDLNLPNGLVRGAERLEGTLFKPLGMLNAGQPRQRGTQLIQWDQYDLDDPRLLEKTLRLPASF